MVAVMFATEVGDAGGAAWSIGLHRLGNFHLRYPLFAHNGDHRLRPLLSKINCPAAPRSRYALKAGDRGR
jgi:hypothetical protein